ncbi:putative signal transducing protein [Maledivibacter halophilus]|uniref:Putative signal transducing protein n=1 Tax=Maledivibacter halophilus TaxID=36842 RepID=A0A1T5IIN4_9FIRM|nr:DUF2007 domain-containing protein [Maledivibacter halophilus]SKC38898.1 Putative signal transducing protein [Maledivibacter halophilus]
MKICPKCKSEYRKGFEYCSDCNLKLEDKKDISVIKKSDKVEIEYLMSVSNEIEAKQIEDILKYNGINILKKHRGAGEYLQLYLGMSNLGIDIYVSSDLKEVAENIIIENLNMQKYYEENIDPKNKEDFNQVGDNYNRERKIWIFLIVFSILTIIGLLIYLL